MKSKAPIPTISEALIKHLSTLFQKDETPLSFRLSIDKDEKFSLLPEDIIQTNDEIILETPDLVIVCDSFFHDAFRGWTIDYIPTHLDMKVVFYHPELQRLYFTGDKYPGT